MNSLVFPIYVRLDGASLMVNSVQAEFAPKPQFPQLLRQSHVVAIPTVLVFNQQLYSKENANVATTQMDTDTAAPLLEIPLALIL